MKESDIRTRGAHNRYLALAQKDAEGLLRDQSVFADVNCPACGSSAQVSAFVKTGFTYESCPACETLFVSPRPSRTALMKLYADSPSTRYWVEKFFTPMAESRREKIFRPRAEHIASRFPSLSGGRVGDVGAGFGLFLEELKSLWPESVAVAIEPSVEMAAILRGKGIAVLEQMLEDVEGTAGNFDLLTAFELFEHLQDPASFLAGARALLKPGGYLYLTTLNGQGFDIQLLWDQSKSVSPPHHLNFLNPRSMSLLLRRSEFEVIEISTPGELDWDIVEGGWRAGEGDPGRFFRTVASHGSPETKTSLQRWIRESGFSSHMRAIARRPE